MKLVHAETSKPGIAPSNAFVLVEWCSILLQEITEASQWDLWGLDTIQCCAQVLELCLGEYSRPNVKHSALVVTRRALRKVFSRDDDSRREVIESVVKTLAGKKTQASGRNAIMLGVVAGVCARKPEAGEILSTIRQDFYAFYTREIIGSRTPVPAHIAEGLNDFFVAFTNIQDLSKEVIPALEKALLRSPEIVLNDLVTPLFRATPTSMDLSRILAGNLLKPLLSNVKSSNPLIRQGSLLAFKAAIEHCTDADSLSQIADEIMGPLKGGKLSAPEQRAVHAEMLAVLPLSIITVEKISPSIATVAVKEPNEPALISETSALLHFITWSVLHDIDLDKALLDAFSKGLSDKKVPIKRLWSTRLAEVFWAITDQQLVKTKLSPISDSVIGPILDIWQETLSNPITAAQGGLIGASYALTALFATGLPVVASAKVTNALKKVSVEQNTLCMEPKPSFLLNPRIYGKLSSDDEYLWFVRALSSVASGLKDHTPDSTTALGWSQAILFSICSASVKPQTRKLAIKSLSEVFISSPAHVTKILVNGLWQWRDSVEAGEKDSAAAASRTSCQNLHFAVKAICLPPSDTSFDLSKVDESVRQEQMIALLVIARPDLLPRVQWIELCLRVEIDPGNLARGFQDDLLDQVIRLTRFSEKVSSYHPQRFFIDHF